MPSRALPLLIKPRRFDDDRGWFMQTWSRADADRLGLGDLSVQDNHSLSIRAGTVRGFHFQRPPRAQAKLVRCLRGAIMDYAVDLRRGSPTRGRWLRAELSARNGRQLYVPVGFGHGFVTLTPDVEVAYKVSAPYAPELEGGVRWDDPAIAADWPLPPTGAMLSDRDAGLPPLDATDAPFDYDGAPLGLLEEAGWA